MSRLKFLPASVLKRMCTTARLRGIPLVQWVAVALSCIVVCIVSSRAVYSVPFHNDEISWFFHTQFFEKAFITHDIASPFWYSYESYDHPQLSKYIFGAYVWLRKPSVFADRDHLEKTYGRWGFYFNPDIARIRDSIFAPYLRVMREANLLFVMGSFLMIGIIIFLLTDSIIFSAVSLMIIVCNRFFMSVLVRGTSDAQMIFFMLTSFVLYVLYGRKNRIIWLVASSVCAGLALSAKLTGVLAVYGYLIAEILSWANAKQSLKAAARAASVFIAISACVWILLNPALYSQPVAGTIHYFDFRYMQLGKLQYAFPGVSLASVPVRIHAVYCTVIASRCVGEFFQGSLFPLGILNIVAMVVGIIYFFVRMKDASQSHMIMSFSMYALATLCFSTIMLFINSDRYYTSIQAFIYIMELVGMYYVCTLCHRFFRHIRT